VKRFSSAMLFLAFFAWAWPLHATTVVIVRPPSPSSAVAEAVSRVHGELLSVGLEAMLTDRPVSREQPDYRAWLGQVAAGGARSIIDVIGDEALVAVDVWIVKSPPGRFEVTRIAAEPNTANPSERLALRTIEALRAGLVEIDLAARLARGEPLPKPSPPAAQAATEVAPAKERVRLAFEIGAAGLMSLDGVGPAILPTVRAAWAARSWFVLQAALTGAGSRPTVTTTAGHAQVAQQYGILGTCFRLGSERRFWPFVGLAVGLLHTSVEGQSGVSLEGHDVDRWSFLSEASLGAGLRFSPRYYMALAAHVQVADPYVAIHVADAIGATTGRPNLLLTLTVGAWL